MKTVVERRDDLRERYIPPEPEEEPNYYSSTPKPISTFYNFGERKTVGFGELVSPPIGKQVSEED